MSLAPVQRLLKIQHPAGVQIQLEPRKLRSPVNLLLDVVEGYISSHSALEPRLNLVWIQGGGTRAEYLVKGDDVYLVQGDLDLRLRSAMRAILTWDRDLSDHPAYAMSLSARIAAEWFRYGNQRKLARLLVNEAVRPMEIATVDTLERVPIGIPYLAQWTLAIAHEAGHFWADKAIDQSIFDDSSPIRELLAEKCLAVGFEPEDDIALLHEATADAFAAETWWAFVDGFRFAAGIEVSPDDLRLEQMQCVYELVLHFRTLNWLQEVRSSVTDVSADQARAARRALYVRELMTIDQFVFNRDEDGITVLHREEITRQWKNDIRELWATRDVTVEAVLVRTLLEGQDKCSADELRHRLEWFYVDTAPPTDNAILALIERSGASPRYYTPAPRESWWSAGFP